jgi:hypothetical protein
MRELRSLVIDYLVCRGVLEGDVNAEISHRRINFILLSPTWIRRGFVRAIAELLATFGGLFQHFLQINVQLDYWDSSSFDKLNRGLALYEIQLVVQFAHLLKMQLPVSVKI